MVLVYEGPVSRVSLGGLAPDGASDLFVPMEKRYLDVYGISSGDRIEATVESISENRRRQSHEELEGYEGELISWNNNTRLFLSRSFFVDLRDWGFVEEGFMIRLLMESAETTEGRQELYPHTEKVYEG